MLKSDISSIMYENGSVETFANVEEKAKPISVSVKNKDS
jgi:hypothetical protein